MRDIVEPDNYEILLSLAEACFNNANYDHALEYVKKALLINPGSAELHNNLGLILHITGRFEEAMMQFRKAIDLQPDQSDVYYNLGMVLKEKGRLSEAIANYEKAIRLSPANADAYVNLGLVLKETGQIDEAMVNYRKALELDPKNTNACINLGIVSIKKGQLSEAIAFCRKALDYDPSNVFAFTNMGNALVYQGRPKEAIECFRSALRINKNFAVAFSNLLCTMNYIPSLGQENIFSEHLRFAERLEKPLLSYIPPHHNNLLNDRKLRIGYVSPDFKKHSVAYFIEPILMSHNRKDFEVFCYSNVSVPDGVTERLQKLDVNWRNIAGMSDDDAATLVRKDEIDILVDLAGHTANNRILLFARKPAPVQVSWIGYPATTGLSAIDYKIVDGFTDPSGMTEQFYTEKLLRLPESFLCYLPDRESPKVSAPPVMSAGHITFGSFNNFAKVSPETVKMWAAIMRAVPNSRLIMKAHSFFDEETRLHALRMFAGEGVEKERIELLAYEPSVQSHLSLYSKVDIALDTFPYNGATTTCEALWMGIPVITLAGNAHASRVGVSLLMNVGLKECIAQSMDEYVNIAAKVAKDIRRLKEIRGNLRRMMLSSPLTDAARFTENLERCYRMMWEKRIGNG